MNTDIHKINKLLRVEAMRLGLCQEWTKAWREDWDAEELVARYIKGLDFCIIHDFPSNALLKELLPSDFLRAHRIYIDDKDVVGGGENGTYVVQGASYGELNFGGYAAATVWVRHDSELLVRARGHSFVVVHCYDDSIVRIEQGNEARVHIREHKPSTSMRNRSSELSTYVGHNSNLCAE